MPLRCVQTARAKDVSDEGLKTRGIVFALGIMNRLLRVYREMEGLARKRSYISLGGGGADIDSSTAFHVPSTSSWVAGLASCSANDKLMRFAICAADTLQLLDETSFAGVYSWLDIERAYRRGM